MISEQKPTAAGLGCSAELGAALRLTQGTSYERQREVASEGGVRALAEWLAKRFAA